MWWSMLESGLALLAACLPTLAHLFTTRSLESAIKSLRSVLSLHSLRSNQTSTKPSPGTTNTYLDIERDQSNESRTGLAKADIYVGNTEHNMEALDSVKSKRESLSPLRNTCDKRQDPPSGDF